MTTLVATLKKTNFGTDAPGALRSLLIMGFVFLLASGLSTYIMHKIFFWIVLIQTLSASVTFFATAFWMIYSSWIFKPKHLAKLVEELNIQGSEEILDMGCGRGMFLCEAAKWITTGHVYGIDLWMSRDQSNNHENATWQNIHALELQDRVNLQTADMCAIPFADDKFDIIISNLAIHNISSEQGRTKALQELLRVLKPGGKFVISDIFQAKQYAKFFAMQENVEFEISNPIRYACPPVTVIRGCKTK